jgi:hypothetical protein
MTKKESQHIDNIMFYATVADNKGVDKSKILSAVCFDLVSLQTGVKTGETQALYKRLASRSRV